MKPLLPLVLLAGARLVTTCIWMVIMLQYFYAAKWVKMAVVKPYAGHQEAKEAGVFTDHSCWGIKEMACCVECLEVWAPSHPREQVGGAKWA